MSDQNKSTYLPFLDGLRALSIIAVLAYHNQGPLSRLLIDQSGWVGVDWFFVLSGFLITGILLREKQLTGTIDFRNFYARRFLRIFPAYYFFLFVFLIGKSVKGHDVLIPFSIAATYMTDVGMAFYSVPHLAELLAHTWSLGVEEKFYFFWPAAVSLAGPQTGVLTLCLSGLCWLWTSLVLSCHGSTAHLSVGFDTKFGALMLGCLAASIWHKSNSSVGAVLKHAWLPWLLLICLLTTARFVGAPTGSAELRLASLPAVTLLFAALLLTLLAQRTSRLRALLSLPPLRWIGRISYSLYLWHGMAYGVGAYYGQIFVGKNAMALEAVEILLAFVFASLSFYLIERPFLKFKARFETERVLKDYETKANDDFALALERHEDDAVLISSH